MTLFRRAILALALIAGITPAIAQVPAPVPALPDTERRTSYSITASTCACAVNFALYGDGTDYASWVEVFINGVRYNFNDGSHGWTITSPSGSLSTLPRPITNAVLTFNAAQTGTVQIVGARRPRRTSQFNENTGVSARNLNQIFTDIIAQNRETWDRTNDVTGRALLAPPSETMGPLPPLADRQGIAGGGTVLGFDGTTGNPFAVLFTDLPNLPVGGPGPVGSVLVSNGPTAIPGFGTTLTAPAYSFSGKVGIGTSSGLGRLGIVGSGATSATSSLSVLNSALSTSFLVRDDGHIGAGTLTPGERFTIVGAGSTSATASMGVFNSGIGPILYARDDGHVGVGTLTPGARMTVVGLDSSDAGLALEVFNSNIDYALSITNGGLSTFGKGTPLTYAANPAKVVGINHGSVGSPVTESNPTLYVSRTENNTTGSGDGSAWPAILARVDGYGTRQSVAMTGYGQAMDAARADTVGVYGAGINYSNDSVNGWAAFGGFFLARGTGPKTNMLAIETGTLNDTGVDIPYSRSPGVGQIATGLDLDYSSTGNHLGGPAIQVRASSGKWDVGLAFMWGDFIRTASIQDDTNSINLLLANSGAHTNGINLAGATFSGNAYSSPGFSVSGTGAVTAASFTGPAGGAVMAASFKGTASGGGALAAAFLASAVVPGYAWQETGAAADKKVWDIIASGASLQFRAVNDANNVANAWMTATRGAGTAVSGVALNAPVTINSSLNILPAAGSLTQGLQVTQTPTGTISGGTPFVFTTANAANYVNMTSDAVNMGDGNEYSAFAVIHKSGGASVLGMRSALHAEQWLTAPTGAETVKDISAATFQVYAQVGNSGGNFIASSSIAYLSGTGAGGLTGHEIDIEAVAGSSTANKFGLTIVQIAPDAAQGSSIDAGIAFYNNGTSGGWKCGVCFNPSTVAASGVGIDMSALSSGSLAYAFKGPGSKSYIDGSGNAAVNTLNVLAGSVTAIIVNGTSSGQGVFNVPAALGSPSVWTLPTSTGTFVVTASSPLVNNAATGNLTCSTCVTSAASLTSNALMIGAGSQASAVTTTGTGVLTALGVNVGTAGAFVVNGGALGTPSSGTLTNATGLPTTGLTGTLQAAQEPAHTGDVTNTAGSLALTLATAQPAVHTWALAQTFTVAPVFTDQSGSRTALGLGTAATQNTGTSGGNVPLLNGANTWSSGQTFSAAMTYGGVTLANSVTGTSSMVLSASPTFTGTPLTTTAAVDTNTTQIASTAFVLAQAASATPLIDGTAAVGTSTRYARGDHVHPTDTTRAPLASPTFTGTVTIPSGGVLGTPTSINLTNATNLPIGGGGTGATTAQGAAANLKVPYVLGQSYVQASHTGDTVESTLATITVPANAMGPNGSVRLTFYMSLTNSANNKTIKAYFNGTGGTAYVNAVFTAISTTRVQVQISNRNATNSQVGSYYQAQGGFGAGAVSPVTSAVDTTASVNLVITGQLASSGETISLEGYTAELLVP